MQKGIVSFKTWCPALLKGDHRICLYLKYSKKEESTNESLRYMTYVLMTASNSTGVASSVFKLIRTMTGRAENSGMATVRIVWP